MSDVDEEFNDETLWEIELEVALLKKCDYGTIRNITKLRPIPDSLRSKVWKICLDIQQDIDNNEIAKWKEIYDLPQQQKIRADCEHLAEKLYPNDSDQQLSITSTLESIITFYCVKYDENYEKDNGWMEILYPIMALKLDKNETFNIFSAIIKRYIPKDCVQNGSPFHLFRLLMLYHDPALCAFLDTKKMSPDSYAHVWFRSLFAAKIDVNVVLNLWDMYFQLGDQFLIFFMPLILLLNMKDDIMSSNEIDKSELLKMIQNAPTVINVKDLSDFNNLCHHFALKTPQSFRKEYKKPLFEGVSLGKKASSIYQALCLPVSVDELLQANQLGSGVRYFIIDCRPAEKYNASHYATAFHLDANLMLENPNEFNQSVEALLNAQKQAITSGSIAGGQHLCFMGSGNEEEDKYVNMVVSNFLHRQINFISVALGGYEELKRTIEDPEMIVGTDTVTHSRTKFTEEWVKSVNNNNNQSSMFNRFSSVFKTKSVDLKGKVKDYLSASLNSMQIANVPGSPTSESGKKEQTTNLADYLLGQVNYSSLWPQNYLFSSLTTENTEKHVSSSDKIGKLYRNQGNLFAIDDTNDDDNESESRGGDQVEVVNLKVWLNKPDTLKSFKCFYKEKKGESSKSAEWVPGYLVLTKTHMYCFTQRPNRKEGMVEITVRHPLNSIIKIATKSSCPEILGFTYGDKIEKSNKINTASTNNSPSSSSKPDAEFVIKGKDWFFVPEYVGEAASAFKIQIVEIANLISS